MLPLRVSLVLAIMSTPALALAHAELLWPPDRANTNCDGGADDECKTGPCGGTTGDIAGAATTLTQGSSITIQFQETISHPGHYELRLSTNGGLTTGLSLYTWALNDNIPDIANGNGVVLNPPQQYTYTMTVPTSLNCNPCVLQFLQFMSNNNQFYYSCSDVRILAAGAPTPTPTETPGVTPTPTPDNNVDEMGIVHGGCVCSTTAASSASGWLVLMGISLVALLGVRRTR